jgi:hypothetical protein
MSRAYAAEKLFLIEGEDKTFGFDYSKTGQVKGGGAISNPEVEFVDGDGGVLVGTATVNTTAFKDFDLNKDIPANKGVIVRLDATGTITPGTYTLVCIATVGTDPAVKILGDLVVTDAGGAIP